MRYLWSFLLCAALISPPASAGDTAKKAFDEQAIKKGDLLHVTVIGHDDLTKSVTVNAAGKIKFPLVKELDAEGLSIAELGRVIEKNLVEFIRYPQVTVDYHNVFYVYGEINEPGEFRLDGRISALKAIIIAGGFTDFASHKVKIIRNSLERKDISVNVDKIISGKGKDKDVLIEPGDVIIVSQSFF